MTFPNICQVSIVMNWAEFEPEIQDIQSQKLTSAARIRLMILNAIGAGALVAGTRVIETELGKALKVSRTPLREALTALRAEQVLDDDGDGLRVRRLAWRDVSNLYELRGTLEGMAARLAADTANTSEKAIISNLCHEEAMMIDNGADAQTLAAQNRRFHQAILHSANNPFLTEALHKLSRLTILLGNTVYSMPERRSLISQEHFDIERAIISGDGVQAEQMMRFHLEKALEARLKIMTETREQELD